MKALILYPLLTASLWYLAARAMITEFLWSNYPRKLAVLVDCASCFGFWLGVGVAATFQMPFFGLDPGHPTTWGVVGLCSIVWTPGLGALHHLSMTTLGTTLEDP